MTTTDRIQQMQDTIIDLCNTDNDAPRLIREALHDFLMQHLPEAGWYAPQEAEALIEELKDMEKDKTELKGKLEYVESKIDAHEEIIDDFKDKVEALTKELLDSHEEIIDDLKYQVETLTKELLDVL